MQFFRYILVVTLVLAGLTISQAQDWVSYQSQQQINDLVDTGDELLMATDAGLVVMNKETLEFSLFNKANSNLGNNHIQTITQAPNGNYWIGTYDVVLGRFDGNNFQDITIPDNAAFDQHTILYDFEIAPNGDFWLGTSDGVFHRSGQTWLHYDEAEFGDLFFEAWDIEIDNNGEVIIASTNIHKYVDGTWSNISGTTQLLGYLDAELFFSSTGDLYLAGDLERIGRFDGEQWQEYDNGGLNGSQIMGFAEDLDGNVYFYTMNDGIYQLTADVWTPQADVQATAFDDKVSYFHIDEQGHRWLNSNIHLSVNKNGAIQSTLISQHTIEGDNIYNLHKGANGYMYFLTASANNISVVDTDGNWSFLPYPNTLIPFESINDMLFITANDIWLATNNGLHHYNGSEWIFDEREPCRSFAMDNAQGKIYVRASDRIYIIADNTMTEYNLDNSPITDLILSGHGVDPEGNLWLASFSWEGDNALQKVATDGSWTTYTDNDYPALEDRPAGDFHFDNNGHLWVPCDLVGAIKFDGENFTNPIRENISQLENYNAFSIASNAAGKIYFSHQYGLTTLLDGEWEHLPIADIPNTNSSSSSNITFDDAGTLWWASNRYGVFSYPPEISTAVFPDFAVTTNFSVYPNPTKNYTVLDFTMVKSANVNAAIYNHLGQLVKRHNFGQLPAGSFQQTIDLTDLVKGYYSIQLEVNGKYSAQAIIIQ